MKVLFIGYLREASGYGQSARDYVLALDAAGVDVVVRCVNLGGKTELPERIKELESKDSAGCDVCIQNLLPHHMVFNGKFKKNIGLFYWETSNFNESSWSDQLNLMDEVIVPCRDNWRSVKMSGVNVPIHVVPIPTDISRFERGYKELGQLKPYREQGNFLFYVIGEWVRRKNFNALLRAFHTEFDPSENVELVIKSNVPGLSPAESRKFIEDACGEIKRALKLHGGELDFYKKEIVITERLSQEGIMKLHASCDCFVLPSHGEAWSIPAFDAMAMGNTPIVTADTCFEDYIVQDGCHPSTAPHGGYLVRSYDTQVYAVNDSVFADLYTGRELWKDVDSKHLQQTMRNAFENMHERHEKAEVGRDNAYRFTYEHVGKQLKKVLYGQET